MYKNNEYGVDRKLDHYFMQPYRFYVENIFEMLDFPGEYFLDNDNKKLYYYSEKNQDPNFLEFRIISNENLKGKPLLSIGSYVKISEKNNNNNGIKAQNVQILNIILRNTERAPLPTYPDSKDTSVNIPVYPGDQVIPHDIQNGILDIRT